MKILTLYQILKNILKNLQLIRKILNLTFNIIHNLIKLITLFNSKPSQELVLRTINLITLVIVLSTIKETIKSKFRVLYHLKLNPNKKLILMMLTACKDLINRINLFIYNKKKRVKEVKLEICTLQCKFQLLNHMDKKCK